MKMTISWSFSYKSFVKFHGKQFGTATRWSYYIQVHVITRCVIKELHENVNSGVTEDVFWVLKRTLSLRLVSLFTAVYHRIPQDP